MLDVYYSYWNTGTYRNGGVLKAKILHSHENICACLAKCTDELFVRENFRRLKAMGYYPYPFRKETVFDLLKCMKHHSESSINKSKERKEIYN